MEVEDSSTLVPTLQVATSLKSISQKDQIIDYLTDIDSICFKSQQIGETDLNKAEKTDIASTIFDKSKLNFLIRFGKYLRNEHLTYFKQFTINCEDSYEINLILNDLIKFSCNSNQIKNRRFEALKHMIEEDSYFSENEMMKRDPLLYEQLVGQYLTEDERRVRDQIAYRQKSTLVEVIMEGIERDNADLAKRKQKEDEEEAMEDSNSDSEDNISMKSSNSEPTCSRWGEFDDEEVPKIRKKKRKKVLPVVTNEEQQLLKEEFQSIMYERFLEGKDEDFNYDSVDNNEKYDSMDVKSLDEEDKYFDSEEADAITSNKDESSEDELDIYMNALNQHPTVIELSKNLQNL